MEQNSLDGTSLVMRYPQSMEAIMNKKPLSNILLVIVLALSLTSCGSGQSRYDECMESHQRLAGLALQALLDGNEALLKDYEQQMLNIRVTCQQISAILD